MCEGCSVRRAEAPSNLPADRKQLRATGQQALPPKKARSTQAVATQVFGANFTTAVQAKLRFFRFHEKFINVPPCATDCTDRELLVLLQFDVFFSVNDPGDLGETQFFRMKGATNMSDKYVDTIF